MITVVLDANQYVSALLDSRSNSAKIVKLIHEGYIDLLISAPTISELRRVLAYPKLTKVHGRTPKGIEQFIKKLEKIARVTPGKLLIQAVKDDPTDDKYLVCAVEGRADFIVSGDRHLKDLKQFQGIPIVDPATFLRLVFDAQEIPPSSASKIEREAGKKDQLLTKIQLDAQKAGLDKMSESQIENEIQDYRRSNRRKAKK